MFTKKIALLSALTLLLAHGLNAQNNTLTTIAGNGNPVGDGVVATIASLHNPFGVAVDAAGNTYVADASNNRIRRIDAVTGIISTVAGGGNGADGTLAISASLNYPTDVEVDASGNLYIADCNNQRIRKVTAATGIISTIGGNGTAGFSNAGLGQFYTPTGLALDGAGNVYVADQANQRIRRITPAGVVSTIAGTGTPGFGGDGGAATAAAIYTPSDLTVDAAGNIFLTDQDNNRIRRIAAATGIISTVAGTGTRGYGGDGGLATAAQFSNPRSVAVDASGNLYITDFNNYRVRMITVSTGIITTVAGNGTPGITGNGGAATAAAFYNPWGIDVDASGNLYISDENGNQVRKVTMNTGIISLLAGYNPTGSSTFYTYHGFGGLATQANINAAQKPARFGGDLYFPTSATQSDVVIARVSGTTGILSQVYGVANGTGVYPNDGGLATQTNIYAADGLAMDASGNIYYAENSYHRVRRIDAVSGVVTTIMGDGTAGSSNTGMGRVNTPKGVAIDASGNVYVADFSNHRVRRVTPAGVVSSIAGTGSAGFSGDGGSATSAALNTPTDVSVDGAGNVYVLDNGNNRVRRITVSTGIITTVAGNGSMGVSGDGGLATAAALSGGGSLFVDGSGGIYLAQAGTSYGVRYVAPSTGIISPIINTNWGTGTPLTTADGANALQTGLDNSGAVFVDASGLYTTSSFRIRRMIAATGVTIATGADPNFSSCTDSVASAIPFFTTGTFNSGNVFTAQLSDASGSFANPINIGSVAGTASGSIRGTFPTNLVSGNQYQIRVVSSSPAYVGTPASQNYSLPRISALNQPAAVDLCLGASLVITAASGPSPRSFQWYNAGGILTGETGQSYTASASGQYYAYVSDNNTGCAGNTNAVGVTVRPVPAVPTITPNTAQILCAGNSLTLTRNNVSGQTYQWIQGAGTAINGATGLTYTTTPVASDSFRVVTTNSFGCRRTSAGVLVTVNARPSVTVSTSGPTNFNNGGTVTLSVPAGAASYQWSNNGTAISGATAAALVVSTSGNYTVTATNSNGCAATSAATTVSVFTVTAAVTPAAPAPVCQGGAVLLTASAATGNTYQWRMNGTPISGATAQTLTATASGSYSVVVTNSGLSATSNTVVVTVNQLPNTTITVVGTTTFCSGNTVTLNTPAGAGAYQWSNNGTAISGATAASLLVNTGGSYTLTVTSNAGCVATSAATVMTVTNCAPVVTTLAPASAVCAGGNMTVAFSSAAIFNGGNMFTAQLSDTNGVFGTTPTTIGTLMATTPGAISATISAAQLAGTRYRIRVVSSNPALTGAANSTNFTVNALPTAAQTTISPAAPAVCAGSAVTLTVPNTAGMTYQWRASGTNITGATANVVTVSPAATTTYTVVVTTAAGCAQISSNSVVTVNALPVASITPGTTQNICGGASANFSAGTGTALTYQWRNNGVAVSGATASTFATTTTGIYTVLITNSTTGCAATSAPVAVTASCPIAIADTGTRTLCDGTNVTVNFPPASFSTVNVFTLQLSDAGGSFTNSTPLNIGTLTAASAASLTGTIPAGTVAGNGYKLRVVTSSPATTGLTSVLTVRVRNAMTIPQQLCNVSIDTAFSKNRLTWNKPTTVNVDSFVFYRQNDVATYSRIGAQAYPVFSTWTDATSTPLVEARRYYMTAKNGCGESPVGNIHRTMHLTMNKGLNNSTTCNLIWNGYEGVTHTYYNIYRGTTTANLAWIGSVPSGSYNSYTDLSMPTGTVYYRVSAGDAPACAPSKGTSENYEEIFSNIVSAGAGGFANWMDMGVYPNPSTASGTLLIESSRMDEVYEVRITDITGRVVEQLQTVPGKENSFGAALAPGLYLVEAASDNGKQQVKKWMKR